MRLDHYVKMGNDDIHMASIIYSLLIILALLFILGSVLSISVKKDLTKINLLNLRRK